MNIVAKSQINVLVQLAQIDKHLAVEEQDMIFRIGHTHQFTDEQIQYMISNPEPVGTLGALSPSQKLNYLLGCVELIYADNKVLDSEILFCRSIAIKMGLRKDVIDFLIENRELSREVLLDHVFAKFMV